MIFTDAASFFLVSQEQMTLRQREKKFHSKVSLNILKNLDEDAKSSLFEMIGRNVRKPLNRSAKNKSL